MSRDHNAVGGGESKEDEGLPIAGESAAKIVATGWQQVDDEPWSHFERVGPVSREQNSNFKLRINLNQTNYNLCRNDIVVHLQTLSSSSCIAQFKTFMPGVLEQAEEKDSARFGNAGQFTIYLKQSATVDEVRALISELEEYLQENNISTGSVMDADFPVSDRMSMRWESVYVEPLESSLYVSARDANNPVINQYYWPMVTASQWYHELCTDQRQKAVVYDENVAVMMGRGFSHFIGEIKGGGDHDAASRNVMASQDAAIYCKALLGKDADFVPLIIGYQEIYNQTNNKLVRKDLFQDIKCHINNFFRQNYGVENAVAVCIEPVVMCSNAIADLDDDDAQRFIQTWLTNCQITEDDLGMFGGWVVDDNESRVMEFARLIQPVFKRLSGPTLQNRLIIELTGFISSGGGSECGQNLLLKALRRTQDSFRPKGGPSKQFSK